MAFTNIDCDYLKVGDSSESSFFSVLRPLPKNGSLVAVGSLAARDSLGGQLASKLALEHFTGGITDFFSDLENRDIASLDSDVEVMTDEALKAIEAAFRRANSSVYSFGHKLAAGGRMAASMIGLVLLERVVSVGRVGVPSAYLYRNSEVYPFFSTAQQADAGEEASDLGSHIGSASLVSVQLSSVVLEEFDTVFLFSQALNDRQLGWLYSVLDKEDVRSDNICTRVLQKINENHTEFRNDFSFAMALTVGPDAIYLNDEVI